jgi:hypothetical protein
MNIWYLDPAHYRIQVPQSMNESDLIRNGGSAWLWESNKNTVTRMAIPAHAAKDAPAKPSAPPMTPQQAASQVLAKVGPTTAVSVDSNVNVAGEAAYQLVLAPKSSSSLIGQVRIAVDGRRNVPLRVQVFAKGAKSPAVQIGFTSVSFVRPAAGNITLSPPAGAKVTQDTPGKQASGGKGSMSGPSMIGKGWLAVADLPQSVLSSVTGPAPSGNSGGSGASALGGDTSTIISALLKSAKHVSGSWGGGRLLRTSLVSVLITDKGPVLVGAVTPKVLYQAATQAAQAGSTHAAPATGTK